MKPHALAARLLATPDKRALARASSVSERTVWRIATEGHRNYQAGIGERLEAGLREIKRIPKPAKVPA